MTTVLVATQRKITMWTRITETMFTRKWKTVSYKKFSMNKHLNLVNDDDTSEQPLTSCKTVRHSTQTSCPSRQGPKQKGDSIKIVSKGSISLLATMYLPTLSFLFTTNGRHWSWFWWTDRWPSSQDDTRPQSLQEETWSSPHNQQDDIISILCHYQIRFYLFCSRMFTLKATNCARLHRYLVAMPSERKLKDNLVSAFSMSSVISQVSLTDRQLGKLVSVASMSTPCIPT